MADTRTFRNYAESLQVGPSQYLVGANERRVPRTSEGLPEGGTTGQAMVKLSDEDYDAAWANLPDISGKANIESPTFTGTPAAPTASPGTNTTQLATTAFVGAAVAAIPSGGDVTGPASSVADRLAVFNGTTGKLIKDGGVAVADLATSTQGGKADTAVQPVRAVSSGSGLTGGGDLSADRTLALNSASIASLAKADSAAQLTVAQQFTKPQRASATPVTTATTMTIDLAANNDFEVTAYANNGTLANPTNQSTQVNQKGTITITQDGSGGHTLSFGSNWKAIGSASAPSINTTAGVTSCIDYHVLSSTVIRYSLRAVGA